MKFHPSVSTKVWVSDGEYHAEWSDRALNDSDRYEPDSVFITVAIPLEPYEDADDRLNDALVTAYDKWIAETR